MILSTGELGLADMVRLGKTKERAYAGQELRLIDLQADQGAGLGCWNSVHGAESAATFSETIRRASERHYGHALPMFVERFMAQQQALLETFAHIQAAFLDNVLLPTDHGQIRRGAQRFAVVAAAGEISVRLGVTPWRSGEAMNAAATLFKRWATDFGRSAQREDKDAIETVRLCLEQYSKTGFWKLRPEKSDEEAMVDEALGEKDMSRAGEGRTPKQWGFYGDHEGVGRLYHFGMETFKELMAGMDVSRSAKSLKDAGFLHTNAKDGRLQNKVRIPGEGVRNFYSVKASILYADEY
jgi:uncharacterized protein (DUF927 family)